MSSTQRGSGSGGGDDPFKNNTPGSMSKKLKEPKKKRGGSKREEEQTSRRRTQNRNSQRAYRERREQRLRELEVQVQEAEHLNQTLSTAYQELKAEMDTLQAEKAQEEYYAQFYSQAGPSYDPAYTASASGTAGYAQSDPTLWDDGSWAQEGWQPEDNSGHGF
ncbi:AP-1-like transcription factor CAP1 [Cytospora mali]|uniref:AP-1-like transcription factor CAP1 n=1 Tax=Cytospora mali TaxID=578113 RepID=A0A194W5L0_CYTMA|nr:AP-1-like transcription factor CAP1 [Valsa mali]